MEKQLARQEIRIATTANFETILTIQELQTPSDTFELKFETVFACAKDPEARRTEASFFVKQEVLQNIEMACSNFLETDVTELQKPAVQHEAAIQTFHIWAKRIMLQYGKSLSIYKTFKIAHALMIFESLIDSPLYFRSHWENDKISLAINTLEEFSRTSNKLEERKLDERLLGIILSIKEYYVINNCPDPHISKINITKTWIEPKEDPETYFNNLNSFVGSLKS